MNWYLKVLKDFTDFKSRSRRKEYWMFVLFNFLAAMIIGIIMAIAHLPLIVINIYQVIIIIPLAAVVVRRMHDTGHSGWWMLCPLYNIYLLFVEGSRESNQYGPDPKAAIQPQL